MSNNESVWLTKFYLQRKGWILQALWSLLSVSLLILNFCPLPCFSLPTNASLCCHSTSRYQTPTLSHLLKLSWEPCLSPYSLYIFLSYSLFLLWKSPVTSSAPSGTSRNKQPAVGNTVIWTVKINIDTGGSGILQWLWNASLVCILQGGVSGTLLIKTWNTCICLCVCVRVCSGVSLHLKCVFHRWTW